ncbi:MAG: SNF2-related protein [Blastocatellia bacterium]
MSLSKLVIDEFDPVIRSRGMSYYNSGAVVIKTGSTTEVRATISGTELFRVQLRRKGKSLLASCNCPYADSYGAPCKHIWATVLEADIRGYLLTPGEKGPLRVLLEDAEPEEIPGADDNIEIWDEDDDEDEEEEDDDEEEDDEDWDDDEEFDEEDDEIFDGREKVTSVKARKPAPVSKPRVVSQEVRDRLAALARERWISIREKNKAAKPAKPAKPAVSAKPAARPDPDMDLDRDPDMDLDRDLDMNLDRDLDMNLDSPIPEFPETTAPVQEEAGKNGAAHADAPEDTPAWTPIETAEDVARALKRREHRQPGASATPAPPSPAKWEKALSEITTTRKPQPGYHQAQQWTADRELVYVIDTSATLIGQGLVVETMTRERRVTGQWGKIKPVKLNSSMVALLRDQRDQSIVACITGAREATGYGYYYGGYYESTTKYEISHAIESMVVPLMCQTGRCLLRPAPSPPDISALPMLRWDDGEPWKFVLRMELAESGAHYVLKGLLRRGEESVPLAEPLLLTSGGTVLWQDRAAFLDHNGAFQWLVYLRKNPPIIVPLDHRDSLVEKLLEIPELPRLELPADLQWEEITIKPRPRLTLKARKKQHSAVNDSVTGWLSFEYDTKVLDYEHKDRGVYRPEQRQFLLRNKKVEEAAYETLLDMGFRLQQERYNAPAELTLPVKKVPIVVRDLLASEWHVEAEGNLYRKPGKFDISVTSGLDWFDLHGSVDFGGVSASLPTLLDAVRRGENTVRLGDGTFGLLPEEWLKKYASIAGLGESEGDAVRFSRAQVGLLDALIAAQPDVQVDEIFSQAREELKKFKGVKPADPPASFVGELREYQREGLGWLYFLDKFRFGGCLADDMGLGKTVQVLSLLESRRLLRLANAPADPDTADKGKKKTTKKPARGKAFSLISDITGPLPPSLVIVPKSLVFNWIAEAAKFTPAIRVLDHTGMARPRDTDSFNDYDIILTTYGTLRRDMIMMKDYQFDYVILDEAQAIKNADTDSAKAVRLLQGRHRLAMSGTPIENHFGELWSLFEFLNPGLLGSSAAFAFGSAAAARNPGEDTRRMLAYALRPFILRRTKEQVAKDLPEKLEQTIYCEMETAQRKMYNDLRDHYRNSLLGRIDRDGINKSKMHILEALLRLRQAACHPGLIDKGKTRDASAKLDMLMEHLIELVDEGHKTLVFSQFTSMLSIVKEHLNKEKIVYEYLDGQTRDRQACVNRFQEDPDCKLFLISLKAGGLGLNLTAADYVFLLDPWWNPAVEAQAIDRAHRIGQTKQVFAYRLIARDTVEEKVLELQKTKRDLADAIINADNSLIRSLQREDLELLLS